MPKLVNVFHGTDPTASAFYKLGLSLFGDQLGNDIDREKLYALERGNTETDLTGEALANTGNMRDFYANPQNAAHLFASGQDVGNIGKIFLQQAASQYGIDAPQTDEAIVGTGGNYSSGATAFNKKLAAEVQHNQAMESADLAKNPLRVDTGTGTALFDPSTHTEIGVIPKDVAGEATQRIQGENQGKLASGISKATQQLSGLNRQWDIVDQQIDDAIKNIDDNGRRVAGVGSWLSVLPETSARTLSTQLKTIGSNIGLDKLQEMRASSPTGGALGNVSNYEDQLLQSVKGSLDQGLTPGQLRANLLAIKKDLAGLRGDTTNAFARDYGIALNVPSAPAPVNASASAQPDAAPSGAETPINAPSVQGASQLNYSPSGNARPIPAPDKIALLKQYANNPDARAAFDSIYGAGAADHFLAGGR